MTYLKPQTVRLIIALLLLSFSNLCKAQSVVDGLFVEISNVLKKQTTYKEAPFVAYDSIGKELQINDDVLPVKKDVILASHAKKEKSEKTYIVQFYYQKGAAVRNVKNTKERKAYFELKFTTKKDSEEFIRLFNQLKEAI